MSTLIPREALLPYDHVHNAGNNQIRVKGLFKETASQVQDQGFDILTCVSPEHILDDETGKVRWYSLQKLFLDMVPDDPTEYNFAVLVFGSMKAWQQIQKHAMLKDKLPQWRQEVAHEVRAVGVRYMLTEVSSEGKNAFRAAEFLIKKGWLDPDEEKTIKGKVGRPSKKEADKEEDAELHRRLTSDAERLGLR